MLRVETLSPTTPPGMSLKSRAVMVLPTKSLQSPSFPLNPNQASCALSEPYNELPAILPHTQTSWQCIDGP